MKKSAKKILILENNQEILKFLSTLLKNEGYSVIPIDHGNNAIKAINKNVPELIICDLKAACIFDNQFLKFYKKLSRTMLIPIIFLSDILNNGDLKKIIYLNASSYIKIPFSHEDFLQLVKKQLNITNRNLTKLQLTEGLS